MSGGNKYTEFDLETTKAYPDSKTLTGSGYMMEGVEYQLLTTDPTSGVPSNRYNTELQTLLSFADHDNMRQVRINRTSQNLDKWGTAIWNTALYDFKKKRFKCRDITYNTETGRVQNIYFEEI